jgi:hypothetical protein
MLAKKANPALSVRQHPHPPDDQPVLAWLDELCAGRSPGRALDHEGCAGC